MDAFSRLIFVVICLFLENTDFMQGPCTSCKIVIAMMCGVMRL